MSLFDKFITEGNEKKADELAKEGAILDGGDMAQVRAVRIQQERGEVYAAVQYAACFHCLVEEWKGCEELRPKPKEKWAFCPQTRGSKEASQGVVCRCKQILVCEMRKKKQTHEKCWEHVKEQSGCEKTSNTNWEDGQITFGRTRRAETSRPKW